MVMNESSISTKEWQAEGGRGRGTLQCSHNNAAHRPRMLCCISLYAQAVSIKDSRSQILRDVTSQGKTLGHHALNVGDYIWKKIFNLFQLSLLCRGRESISKLTGSQAIYSCIDQISYPEMHFSGMQELVWTLVMREIFSVQQGFPVASVSPE